MTSKGVLPSASLSLQLPQQLHRLSSASGPTTPDCAFEKAKNILPETDCLHRLLGRGQGNEVDVQGNEADVQGDKADVQGNEADVQGNEADVRGKEADVTDFEDTDDNEFVEQPVWEEPVGPSKRLLKGSKTSYYYDPRTQTLQ